MISTTTIMTLTNKDREILAVVTDIQNKDEEFGLEKALRVLMSELNDYWLIKVFQFEKI